MIDGSDMIRGNVLALFLLYAKDAGNWNGTPLVEGNVSVLGPRGDRGLLAHIKKAGLATTFEADGELWLEFTEKGITFAAEHGVVVESTGRVS
jgi:hypothetical protein